MEDLRIQREHIEQTILSSFINQNYTLILDKIEFEDMELPFHLFKANRTIKLTAKAIYNLQQDKKPIDEINVISYIKKHTTINVQEFLDISCKCSVSFDTMNLYLNQLKEIDEEETKREIMRGLI